MKKLLVLAFLLMPLVVFPADIPIQRNTITTNQFMNQPQDGWIAIWNNVAQKWSNGVNTASATNNAQPPSTTLTNLSTTGAITNANANQFAAITTLLSIKDGALLTNIITKITQTILGQLNVASNAFFTNSLQVIGRQTNNSPLRVDNSFSGGSAFIDIIATGGGSTPPYLNMDGYGAASAPLLQMSAYNGTLASPTALGTGDAGPLFYIAGRGSSQRVPMFGMVTYALNNFTDSDHRALTIFRVGDNTANLSGKDVISFSAFNITNDASVYNKSNLVTTGLGDFLANVNVGMTLTVVGSENLIGSLTSIGAVNTFAQDVTVNGPFIANDSLRLPRGGNPTVNDFGEIAADNDAWGSSRGAPRFYDGTSDVFLIGALTSDTPTAGQVPKWNSDGTITWEDDNNSGGGGGGAGTLPMNSNQFDTNNPASIKSGALVTNLIPRGVNMPGLTASSALALNASGDVTNANTVSLAELEFLGNVTSDIQTQFTGKQNGQSNATQFGASTVQTLRDGVTVTNANLTGTTHLTNSPVLRFWSTANSYTEFVMASGWTATNRVVFWQTNAAVGQVWKVNSVSISSGIATVNMTNDFLDGGFVTFADVDNKFASNTVSGAISELNDVNGSGPNASDGKVSWTQLVGVPAGFADGTDDGAGSATTNVVAMGIGTPDITNAVRRYTVRYNGDTNIVVDWTKTNYVVAWPSNTFTVSWVNSPPAGSPAQTVTLEIVNTNSTAAFFPTNGLNNSPVIMLSAPSTNFFYLNFDGTNFWTESGQILTTGLGDTNVFNSQPVIHSQTMVGTNTVTGNFGYTTALLSGTGGALTNYTLFSDQADRYINGFTNVSIRAVYNTTPGLVFYWNLTITNLSGTDRTLEFSVVTNRFRFSGVYGTNAPSVLTNNTGCLISGRSDGTNTQIGYTYFAAPL